MKIKISVITPVWNKSELTQKFYDENWKHLSKHQEIEWICVNNGSTDNTKQILQDFKKLMGSRLKIVNHQENKGFGEGHNAGALLADGDYLIHISNDVQIIGDYITPIKYFLENNPKSLVGDSVFRQSTGWNEFGLLIIPYVQGHCIGCTKETWVDLQGFDPIYSPCDYEDVDLSFTATKKGYSLVELNLPLRHYSGQTAQNLPEGRINITNRNRKRFVKKWNITE